VGKNEGRPVFITRGESTWRSTYVLLLELKEFTPMGGSCKVYVLDRRNQEHISYERQLSVLLQMLRD